jgi:nucleotide-binding universal stress UspA family protein
LEDALFQTILVPLDGSELARRALPYAASLARRHGARLILLHAYAAQPRNTDADPELDMVKGLSTLAHDLRQQGVQVQTWLSYDESGPAIVQTATDLKADLLVMSTHGRSGLSQLLFGSVTAYVVRHTSLPVVLVTEKCRVTWPDDQPLSILVPLDGTPFAELALAPARALAAAQHATLVLLRTPVPTIARHESPHPQVNADQRQALDGVQQYLDAVSKPIMATGQRVVTCAETGTPAAAIARLVNDLQPALVVMATHGRGPLSRLLLETVASETLHLVTAPILLVRPAHAKNKRPAAGDSATTTPS